jgi:hypothetical protein
MIGSPIDLPQPPSQSHYHSFFIKIKIKEKAALLEQLSETESTQKGRNIDSAYYQYDSSS